MNDLKKKFRDSLVRWNREHNRRAMPWKGIKDPYRIWLSEIILQQTRVEQGLSYYNRFIIRYPNLLKLAAAPDNEVFKLWEGLGYYSRCRNLLSTARKIQNEYGGIFPDKYEDLLQLPGIGTYTAAAISSFAYNLPHAVVDGNVIRVLSRYFMISEQFNTAEGKKLFAGLASELLDKKKPGIYNQAIMDFGATVCKPVPLCESCALRKYCLSFQKGMQLAFPVKAKRAKKRNRWFYYFLIEDHGRIYYRKRTERDIWQNLHEFILFESGQLKESSVAAEEVFGKGNFLIKSKSPPYSQTLTHQEVQAVFIHGGLKAKGRIPKGYSAASPAMLRRKAFPRIISRYLSETGFLRKASGI